jgi:hypothetical protein
MSNAFVPIVRTRPCPIFGRPVHPRVAPIDYSPILLLKPFGFRIAPNTLSSGKPQEDGFRSVLAVSGFRLCARLDFSIPSFFSQPARHYPRLWIQRPSSERRGDFNPHDSCAAQRTLRTHPPPSRLRSFSRLRRLYDLPCSGDFSPGRGGLLQLLGMSLPPCCRFHPAEIEMPRRSDFGTPYCLRPSVAGSALGLPHFRGHLRVYFRYGPVTRNLPTGDLVDRLQSLGFPPPCYPNYGAPDFCPGRFVSC